MISTLSSSRRIEILLSSLEGETHARRALVSEVCEELARVPELAQLHGSAQAFLVDLERGALPESRYSTELQDLMTRFRALTSSATPAAVV